MTTNNISADIYELTEFTNSLKDKFIEGPSNETLAMGIFGYMGSLFANLMQDTVVRASEYSNEAIATRAKFEKNIITHALSLGIDKIFATPSIIKAMLCLPEVSLIELMKNNKFVLDKDIPIYIGDYEFHLDYDIIITKKDLSDGYTYSAMYNINLKNELSDITNPYLPPVAIIAGDSTTNLVVLTVTLRQVEHTTVYKKILTDNVIENKTLTFSFDSQIADFYVECVEGNETHYLTPIYDGLNKYDDIGVNEFCNYTYLNANTIRIKFDPDSYEPVINCDVTVRIKTCQGAKGNFTFKDDIQMELESEKYGYSGIYMLIKPISDAQYGVDKKSVADIKKIIPKEASSRGSIINTTDLENFFNSIDTDNNKVYFYKKRDNQIERLYYSYLLLKDNDNVIIPTNTLDIKVKESDTLTHPDYNNMILEPRTKFYLPPSDFETGIWETSYCVPGTDEKLNNLVVEYINNHNADATEDIYITTTYFANAKRSYMLSNKLETLSDEDYIATNDYRTKYRAWRCPKLLYISEEAFKASESALYLYENYMSVRSLFESEDKFKESSVLAAEYDSYITSNGLFKTEESLNSDSDVVNSAYDIYLTENNLQADTFPLDSFKLTDTYIELVSQYVLTIEEFYSTDVYNELVSKHVFTIEDYFDTSLFNNESIKYVYDLDKYAEEHDYFVYVNPFLTLIDKNPLYASTFLTTINANKYLEFSYINQSSEIQFISSSVQWTRKNKEGNTSTYELSLDMIQNIAKDAGLIIKDENGTIVGANIKPFVMLTNKEGVNIAYIEGNFDSYDEENTAYKYTFNMHTDDIFTDTNKIRINGLKDVGTGIETYADLDSNVSATIYIFAKFNKIPDKTSNASIYKLFPNVDDYTLCNNYKIMDGLDMFNNYANYMYCPVDLTESESGIYYTVKKVPLIKAKYVEDDSVMDMIIDLIENRRVYMEYCLTTLEDGFGLDLKFFNTYGPTNLFYIDTGRRLNSTNLAMKFRVSTVTNSDKTIMSDIIEDIKNYIEDINEINDLHIPNLITTITNKYREQLNYFEFLDCNGYGPGYQHFYRPDKDTNHIVPEFLNITTSPNGVPSIEIITE